MAVPRPIRFEVTPYFASPGHYDSPYFVSGGIGRGTRFIKRKVSSENWTCYYCHCDNLPQMVKCEHCNAPKISEKERHNCAIWNVTPIERTNNHRVIIHNKVSFCAKEEESKRVIERLKRKIGKMILNAFSRA